MFNANYNPLIKTSLVKPANSAAEYLTNVSEQMIFVNHHNLAVEVCREPENIDWNCAFCQNLYSINIFEFKNLQYESFFCKKCADLPKTSALYTNVMKSSNNLMIMLKNKMDQNFKNVDGPKI